MEGEERRFWGGAEREGGAVGFGYGGCDCGCNVIVAGLEIGDTCEIGEDSIST